MTNIDAAAGVGGGGGMNTYCDDCKRCTGGNMRKSDVPGGDDHNRRDKRMGETDDDDKE